MVKHNYEIRNFWTAFFAVLALVAIVAAVYIGVYSSQKVENMRMSVVDDENYYKVAEENNFKRALYSACDSLKNLDANLGKAAVSQNNGNRAQMLTNVVIHANQVNQNLANLPIAESDNLSACQKFVNQAQDYAIFLLKKTSRGEQLSASERAALSNLQNVATGMYNFLEDYAESDSAMFITNGNGTNGGALSDGLNNVDENTFAYEKLIYDGPFSDSVEEKTLVAGKAVSHAEGAKMLKKIFGEAKFCGEFNSKGLWYSYELENGRALIACDGRLAQYERYVAYGAQGKPLDRATCIDFAEKFCAKLGYDVKGVWVSKVQAETTYVNCATVTDGVIVYPELIKVAVDSFTGEIVGCEARAYLFNHTEREINFEGSQQEAQRTLNPALKVTNVAKALIEKDHTLRLCYEFQCETGGRQYYVYVDAKTGEEVEIFKVIQNTEGYTVI